MIYTFRKLIFIFLKNDYERNFISFRLIFSRKTSFYAIIIKEIEIDETKNDTSRINIGIKI